MSLQVHRKTRLEAFMLPLPWQIKLDVGLSPQLKLACKSNICRQFTIIVLNSFSSRSHPNPAAHQSLSTVRSMTQPSNTPSSGPIKMNSKSQTNPQISCKHTRCSTRFLVTTVSRNCHKTSRRTSIPTFSNRMPAKILISL